MMYAGLRVGEACAVTASEVSGDRLTVAKQVVEVHNTGKPTIRRLGPVKSSVVTVVIPHWLTPILLTLESTESQASARESLRRAGLKACVLDSRLRSR